MPYPLIYEGFHCGICSDLIEPDEPYIETLNGIYHSDCIHDEDRFYNG